MSGNSELQGLTDHIMARIDSFEDRVIHRLERTEQAVGGLREVLVGNGDEQSVVMRLRLLEQTVQHQDQTIERQNKTIEELCMDVTELNSFTSKIQNRAIGVGMGLGLAGGGAALFFQRLLDGIIGP